MIGLVYNDHLILNKLKNYKNDRPKRGEFDSSKLYFRSLKDWCKANNVCQWCRKESSFKNKTLCLGCLIKTRLYHRNLI